MKVDPIVREVNVEGMIWIARASFVAIIIRWGYELLRTMDKPAEWQPPRHQTWPLRLRRNGFRVQLAIIVLLALLMLLWSLFW